ncbi:MAG: hypothetical protein S4CHLAM20_08650 [Chlamydiia bacterium]|nr:hypothetical protein [Chlamydiia bacterium]
MAKGKSEQDPSILEAVDNLSSMAELDIESVKTKKDSVKVDTMRWLDIVDEKRTVASVKATLKVVYNYLRSLYKESSQLKDKSVQKGIISIINLAEEAANKVDEYAKKCKKKINIKNSKEYVALFEFYNNRIKPRFDQVLQNSEKEDEEDEQEDAADIKRRGLKDLAEVTRDHDYELFYLQKEGGGRFFNKSLARHIRLVADFDQIISEFSSFDPLIKIPLLKDDIAYHLCLEIKKRLKVQLDTVLKEAGKYRDDPLVQNVFRGVMALLLASNSRNQLKTTLGKSVSGYFKDFQSNLRLALSSIDYRNYIDNPPEDDFYVKVLDLLHDLCLVLYSAHINTSEAGALIASMVSEIKESKKKSTRSSSALWNTLLEDYEALTKVFKACPNGPLFKVLDILNESDSFMEFDPMLQWDFPGNYFNIKGEKKIEFLKIPSPTMQTHIESANLSFEFTAFIRSLVAKQQRVLLINFQDRTSWKEYGRCHEIEKAASDGELGLALTVVTLAKKTDFYNQSDDYLKIESAQDFKEIFLKQLEGEEDCGFFYPKKLDRTQFFTFCKEMIDEVHKLYFGAKKTLSRKNRLDFIEIAYHMICLYMIKANDYTYIAFSSKDGVDISSSSISSMFAFLKSMSGELEWKVEDEDFMIEMIFSSALIVRERAPHLTSISRIVSMLSVVTSELELNKEKIIKSMTKLMGPFYSNLEVRRYLP